MDANPVRQENPEAPDRVVQSPPVSSIEVTPEGPQIERLRVRSLRRLRDDADLFPTGVPNADQCSCVSP
jgi:hypothetical protein